MDDDVTGDGECYYCLQEKIAGKVPLCWRCRREVLPNLSRSMWRKYIGSAEGRLPDKPGVKTWKL